MSAADCSRRSLHSHQTHAKAALRRPTPQSDGEFPAALTIDGPAPEKLVAGLPGLVAGMTGKVKIVGYFKADALAVPAKAVFHDAAREDQRHVLVVPQKGLPQRRTVTLSHQTE